MWLAFAIALVTAAGGDAHASAYMAARCPVPVLTRAQRRRGRLAVRRQLQRRRRERAPDLMGYRDGPRLGRPSRRERREIRAVRSDRLNLAGLNPNRLLIRRLIRDDSRAVQRRWDTWSFPMTAVEERDMRFQQDRVVPSQDRVARYGRRCAVDSYAGEYPTIRWPEGIHIHVRFTKNRRAHRKRLVARYPYARFLRVHDARFTLRELNAVERRIDADWDELERDGIDVSSLFVAVEDNAVEVWVPRRVVEARRELRRRYGPAVRVVRGEVAFARGSF